MGPLFVLCKVALALTVLDLDPTGLEDKADLVLEDKEDKSLPLPSSEEEDDEAVSAEIFLRLDDVEGGGGGL